MNTQDKIQIMQAFVEGKTVETRDKSQGVQYIPLAPNHEPLWNWESFDYRIKPEPMEIQVWVNGDGVMRFLKEFPSQLGMEGNGYTLKTFVEKV